MKKPTKLKKYLVKPIFSPSPIRKKKMVTYRKKMMSINVANFPSHNQLMVMQLSQLFLKLLRWSKPSLRALKKVKIL